MPFRQVDDNQEMLAAAGPAPRHEVSEAFIVRPAGEFTKVPCAIPKPRISDGIQQSPVEIAKIKVRRFLRLAPELDRQPHLATLELSVVKQFCPWKRGNHHRRSPGLLRIKDCGGSRLVVILDEADEPVLNLRVSRKVKPDRFG